MRFAIVILVVICYFQSQGFAQEADSLGHSATYKSKVNPEILGLQPEKGFMVEPVITNDFRNSFNSYSFALPLMNFNFQKGWEVQTGIGSMLNTPFRINSDGFFRLNGWDSYMGFYGSRTYQVNDKLFFGTSSFSDKSFNGYAPKSVFSNQTNYGSSLFVGYKFSEKFSIHAGFSIQGYNDKWNKNPGSRNEPFFP